MTLYSLVQILVWFYPVISEIPYSTLQLISWIMFLIAMVRIRRAIVKLPNCFANDKVTTVHFVVLSGQGITATTYSILYTVVFMVFGDVEPDSTNVTSLELQTTTNIILMLQIICDSISGIFICYMLMVFSRLNTSRSVHNGEDEQEGPIIQEVPNLVYL